MPRTPRHPASAPATGARKPRGQGHERRAEIMAAAREVFLADGVAQASMRRIAARLGLSSTALYVYFRDKDELLHELCRETFKKLNQRFAAMEYDASDPLDRLRQMMRVYAEFALAHPDEYRLTFVDGHSHPHGPLPDHVPEPDNPYFDGMAAFYVLVEELRRLDAEGALHVPQPYLSAQIVWTGVHGLVSALISEPDFAWSAHDELFKEFFRVLTEGLRAR